MRKRKLPFHSTFTETPFYRPSKVFPGFITFTDEKVIKQNPSRRNVAAYTVGVKITARSLFLPTYPFS